MDAVASTLLVIFGVGLVAIPIGYVAFFSSRIFARWSTLHQNDLIVQLAGGQVLLTMTLSGLVLLGGIQLPVEIFPAPQPYLTLSAQLEQVLLKSVWKSIAGWSSILATFSICVSFIVHAFLRKILPLADPERSFAIQAGAVIRYQCFLLPFAYFVAWLMSCFGFETPQNAKTVGAPAAVFFFSILASSAMYLPDENEERYVLGTLILALTGFVSLILWMPELLGFVSVMADIHGER
ncbi:MAG: hypothetical protein ACSHXK_17165 [Oceanococcus sp.]